MKKKMHALISLIVCVLFLYPLNIFGFSSRIQITLPSFNIRLNGTLVNNEYRQYPFIMHNGITYLPLTYYDTRTLGIEAKLDESKGLVLNQTDICCGYFPYTTKVKNKSASLASFPRFPIKINGKSFANNKQKYPILFFRKMAYLPLTKEIATNELGIYYTFNQKELSLTSSGPQVYQLPISIKSDQAFTLAKGVLYYEQEGGKIYCVPLASPNKAKKVYQLPIWSYGDGKTYVPHELITENDQALLKFHQGGAAVGLDIVMRLNPNGTASEVISGSYLYKQFGDLTVMVSQFVPPSSGNISIKNTQDEMITIGESEYIYGWEWKKHQNSDSDLLNGGGIGSNDLYLLGDDLYILACNLKKSDAVTSIHKINITTYQTTPLMNKEILSFRMEQDKMYYMYHNKLYQRSAKDKTEKILKTRTIDENLHFEVLGNDMYYRDAKNHELYRYDAKGNNQPLNPGAQLTGLKIDHSYMICTFKEDKKITYRFLIFDKSGQIILKSCDTPDITSVVTDNHCLVYLGMDRKINCVQLP